MQNFTDAWLYKSFCRSKKFALLLFLLSLISVVLFMFYSLIFNFCTNIEMKAWQHHLSNYIHGMKAIETAARRFLYIIISDNCFQHFRKFTRKQLQWSEVVILSEVVIYWYKTFLVTLHFSLRTSQIFKTKK